MRRQSLLSRSGALAAILPGTAGVLAALAVLRAWGHPLLVPAAVAGLVSALVVGTLLLRPLHRRLARWDGRLAEATRRLAEAEDRAEARESDPVRVLESIRLPERVPDEAMQDALDELGTAVQEEERLRERRGRREENVREVVRAARDLAGTDSDRAAIRLPELLQEIETGVRQVRESADSVLQLGIASGEVSRLVADNAGAGREASGRATRRSEELEERIAASSKLVRRLESRSREIGQVLIVLNDLTEQTNLLALNAAIIAAQAGEHGQGFGVVADEMRNLSERASSSTKETEILARTLQDDVTKAVQTMGEAQDTAKKVRSALGETHEVGSLLTDLGKKNLETVETALERIERQASLVRDLAGRLREVAGEQERYETREREVTGPTRRRLREAGTLLDELWQLGAMRESLRTRLDGAIHAIRDHRGRERRERAQLEEQIRELLESGREWRSALEAGRRRDDLVRDLAREIRTLSEVATGR